MKFTVDNQAPGFSLPNSNNVAVEMQQKLAESSLVVIFYRGFW